METVRISPPYTAEACSGPDARAVERVKKVVRPAPPAPAAASRPLFTGVHTCMYARQVGGIRNRMTAAREASLTK